MARRSNRADKVARGREFFRRLGNEGLFARTFVFYGDERFLVDEAMRRVEELAFPNGRDDFNRSGFHGGEASGADIASAADQVPMFGDRRLVVVRALNQLTGTDLEAVVEYVERSYASTVLLCEATRLDQRQKAVKRLMAAEHSACVEFPTLSERDVIGWTDRRADYRGLRLGSGAAAYLVGALGTGLQQIDLALERVRLYVGDPPPASVEVDVVREVVPDVRARSVFELTDHLSAGRLGEATGCFRRMMDQGESPIGALAMIARQFRQLVLVRDGGRKGLRGRELAQHIGCPPFVLGEYERAAARFDDERLAAILRAIMETDHALKSSRLPRALLVERLFVRACAG